MRVAMVIGASRGMGRQVALTLAENGYAVGVAAKTTEHSEKTPGTIYDVCKEIERGGGKALPIKVWELLCYYSCTFYIVVHGWSQLCNLIVM